MWMKRAEARWPALCALPPLIQSGTDSGGYDIYYLDIPDIVTQGTYKIELKFYINESDPAAKDSWTFTSGA